MGGLAEALSSPEKAASFVRSPSGEVYQALANTGSCANVQP